MKTHSLDLLFLGMPKDALPGPAHSHVCLKNWSYGGYSGGKDRPLITSQCVSIQEFDHEIDRIHKELELIRATAKRKYAAYERLEDQRFRAKSKER